MSHSLKRFFLSTITLMALSVIEVKAQVPTFQDCLGATPICLGVYINGNVITGTGNYPNEINPVNSCLLTGERNDAWYIITTSSAGNLGFSIIPNNPAHNYDWAVYNLTSSVCSDIFTNPAIEVSCNYSNVAGTTGPNNLPGAQNNPFITVQSGQTYLINVSGFSSIQQNGYTIDFSSSTANVIDNTPPSISNVTAMNCGATSMTLSFSERVLCSSVQASDFTLTGPGGPFTVNSASSSECTIGAGFSRDYVISFSPSITGAGTYTLNLVGTVTDLCSNNANTPQAFQIPISGINISFQKVDVTCFGGNNGSATATVSGAPGPYTYQWSPSGGNTATAQWLTAGTYTVTVTSSLGCSATGSVTINQPLTGMTASATTTPANGCAANGTATVTVLNGQPPYLYNWWPSGGNNATATGLTAGGYMVTITDANQCVLNYFLNVPSSSGPSISISASSNVSCHGGNDGSATVSVSNATGPFSYLWSPSGGTNATATGLTAGSYIVDVIIAPGCTLSTGVTIVEPPSPLSVSVNSNNTSCGNNNGTISLSASGGAGSYSYQWQPNVASGSSVSALPGGTYTITVSDGNGCTNVNTITIQPSTQPVPTLVNQQQVSCFGLSDGSTGVSVSGGAQPINYLWSSGQTAASLNNMPAGTYTVTVTDALGCTATLTDVISQPSLLTASVQNIQHVNCFGDLTGAASVNASGGNGGNIWSWSGSTSSSANIANVGAGNYTATVTDVNGCNASVPIVITQPSAPLDLQGSITPTTCGSSDGSVVVQVSGGTSPYSYQWSNGSQTSAISSLSPGIYTITVTDNNGCTSTESYLVEASDAPVVTTSSITHVTCFGGNDGSVSLGISGGAAPYNWVWQSGVSTGPTATNLAAGNYNITITDASGCVSIYQVIISQPDQVSLQVTPPSTICIGESQIVNAIPTGGTPPYSYYWSNGLNTSQINVNPVITTTYALTVTDANGCETVPVSTVINVNQILNLSASYPDSVCKGSQATITLSASGGDGNYSYNWDNGMNGPVNSMTVTNDLNLNVTLSDGCTTPTVQTSISITAVIAPELTFALPQQSGCAPFLASFDVPAGSPPGLLYHWDFGDNFTSNQSSTSHLYVNPGIYSASLSVTYASAPTCATLIEFPNAVNAYEVPVARFIFDPPAPTLNQPDVYFTDRSTAAVSWLWKFGDGSESYNQNPKYSYRDTGVYEVSLKVLSQEGCPDSTYTIVHVKDDMQVYIPNAFTPDGSGINDYFKIYGVGFVAYEIAIYDRWGKQVHFAKNREQAWDGTDQSSGRPVPQGVYVYKVTITDNKGDMHHRISYVTVIR